MPPSVETARRRIRKFLARTAPGLGQPILDMRDEQGHIPVFTIHWVSQDRENWGISAIDHPHLDKRMLDSVIVECRVFFTVGEDCYLPSVVSALRQLVGPELARARRPLKDHVAEVVRGNAIGASGPRFTAGRLEANNGLGHGRLLGSDLIAMDYIYGRALHEDDERLARLANVDDLTAIRAALYHLNDLLHVVQNVRAQIVHDIEAGHFSLES